MERKSNENWNQNKMKMEWERWKNAGTTVYTFFALFNYLISIYSSKNKNRDFKVFLQWKKNDKKTC